MLSSRKYTHAKVGVKANVREKPAGYALVTSAAGREGIDGHEYSYESVENFQRHLDVFISRAYSCA